MASLMAKKAGLGGSVAAPAWAGGSSSGGALDDGLKAMNARLHAAAVIRGGMDAKLAQVRKISLHARAERSESRG